VRRRARKYATFAKRRWLRPPGPTFRIKIQLIEFLCDKTGGAKICDLLQGDPYFILLRQGDPYFILLRQGDPYFILLRQGDATFFLLF
jgi:hypothetical protein